MAGNSESNKRSAQTKKEKYGTDYHSRIGSMGARIGTPGYFGKLKATDPEKLKQISTDAAHKSAEAKRARKKEHELRASDTEDIRKES